jgi:hypothetical protein
MAGFYAATTITIGNGEIAPFWDSPWINGAKPKDIALVSFSRHPREKNGRSMMHYLATVGLRRSKWIPT